MERALCAHPKIARQMVELFRARFDPAQSQDDALTRVDDIERAIDAVESLDQDQILRSFLGGYFGHFVECPRWVQRRNGLVAGKERVLNPWLPGVAPPRLLVRRSAAEGSKNFRKHHYKQWSCNPRKTRKC